MSEYEMMRLCATAMGYTAEPPASPADIVLFVTIPKHPMLPAHPERYDPITDAAQAMALVEKFHLQVNPPVQGGARSWWVHNIEGLNWRGEPIIGYGASLIDLKRAIVECVAKMHRARSTPQEER